MTSRAHQMEPQLAAPDHPEVVAAVPRVSIHAFCDDQHTAQALQVAFSDRRLARTHSSVQPGGILAAVQTYSQVATPNVLIVETHSDRDGVLAELGQLAQVCDPSSKVIVIGHVNDVLLYRELVRQGVSEYVIAPVHPLQMIASIANLYADPKSGPVGRIFAFVGAKGGVGSSTLAHNVGWTLSRTFQEDVVITDLDLAFGTAGLNFNQDPTQGIAEALNAPERIDDMLIDRLLTKCSDHLSLLAAPGTIERDVAIDAGALQVILDVVRHNVPCVVVDVPNVWAPWTKQTLIQADAVILTATPEIASLRNAKNMVDMLKAARPNDRPPHIVLNGVGVAKRPEISVQDFGKTVGIDPVAVIPYDAQVFGTATTNGQMIAEVSGAAKIAEPINRLAQMLSGRMPPKKPSRFNLAPLLGKLSLGRKQK